MIQVELDSLLELLRIDGECAIGSPPNGCMGIEFNGRGHHKAVVIVSVLPNQVHSPRGTKYSKWIHSIDYPEPCCDSTGGS